MAKKKAAASKTRKVIKKRRRRPVQIEGLRQDTPQDDVRAVGQGEESEEEIAAERENRAGCGTGAWTAFTRATPRVAIGVLFRVVCAARRAARAPVRVATVWTRAHFNPRRENPMSMFISVVLEDEELPESIDGGTGHCQVAGFLDRRIG